MPAIARGISRARCTRPVADAADGPQALDQVGGDRADDPERHQQADHADQADAAAQPQRRRSAATTAHPAAHCSRAGEVGQLASPSSAPAGRCP